MTPTIGLLAACILFAANPGARHEPLAQAEPQFTVADVISTNEGHATLRWSLGDYADDTTDVTFELQQSRDREFGNHRLRHEGAERALFVSGLRDGRTYFRVRATLDGSPPGPWSDPLVVEVDYPSRDRVVLLLAVGCLVFLATVATIVAGWLRNRRPRPAAYRASR
jgi:hypothetical protein